jgi:isopenicillin N synthase-like dioxygenase
MPIEIPVIDISGIETDPLEYDENHHASILRQALETTGFFYLKQTIISSAQKSEVLEQSEKFFALPEDKKRCLFDAKLNRGYTAMGEETLDPSNQKKGDTKEGYYIGRDITDKSEINHSEFRGPNIYPDEMSLNLPNWKSIMDAYYNQACSLCRQLVRLIALALELPAEYFDHHFSQPLAVLRLLQYSQEISNVDEGVLACGAHSDYGFLTLLLTNNISGLQIYYQDEWIDVEPKCDCYVVNIGDMLERWTNGKYKSTLHRVVLSSPTTSLVSSRRLSAPFFFEPNYNTVVKCLPLNKLGKPKYEPVTSGEYLKSKYTQTHADYTIVEN